MVQLQIRIESAHAGPAAGFLQLTIEDGEAVNELIKLFCASKNIPVSPLYAIVNRSNVVFDGQKPISTYDVHNNELLYLGSSTTDGKMYGFGNWFKLATLAQIVGLAGIIICVIIFLKARDIPDSYSIVMDAGSTHTDVIAYKWPGSKINSTGQVSQVQSCTINGGVAYVAPENVSLYLQECFEKVKSAIPKDLQSSSHVLFGATAGLRVLNTTNSTQVTKILDAVRLYLNNSNLNYNEDDVNIISGDVEGLSGWITTNYLEDALLKRTTGSESWGQLDLGGASTQISFEVNKTVARDNPLVHSVTLFGNTYNVLTKSFLCYGAIQAKNRYRALLVLEKNKTVSVIKSPCEAENYSINVTSSDIFNTKCFNNPGAADGQPESFTFVGSGNYEKCEKLISKLLDKNFCDKYNLDDCIDLTDFPDDFTQKYFLAHSAFGYVVEDLKLPANCSETEFVLETKRFCALPLKSLLASSPKVDRRDTPLSFLESLCFNAVYSHTLLNLSYGFNEESWLNIRFQNEVGNSSIGWTLGFMVNATEEIAAGKPVPKMDVITFALLMTLFCIFVLVSVGFIFHAIRIRKSFAYDRLLPS